MDIDDLKVGDVVELDPWFFSHREAGNAKVVYICDYAVLFLDYLTMRPDFISPILPVNCPISQSVLKQHNYFLSFGPCIKKIIGYEPFDW